MCACTHKHKHTRTRTRCKYPCHPCRLSHFCQSTGTAYCPWPWVRVPYYKRGCTWRPLENCRSPCRCQTRTCGREKVKRWMFEPCHTAITRVVQFGVRTNLKVRELARPFTTLKRGICGLCEKTDFWGKTPPKVPLSCPRPPPIHINNSITVSGEF